MCDDAISKRPCLLQYALVYFVTQEQQIKIWHDYDDEVIIGWYEGHQKRNAQKVKIKEELLLIAWHTDRVMNWCMSEKETRLWK